VTAGDRKWMAAGMLLGVGLGGFVDGILFHQLLQWHQMISSVVPPTTLVAAKVNMLWDGVFHTFAWTMTVLGVIFLSRAANMERERDHAGTRLAASFAMGAGMFNVIEGLINHQLLGLHHVRPGETQGAWDAGYILVGAAMAILGARALVKTKPSRVLHHA
jgi:uncharacterized membrane protein